MPKDKILPVIALAMTLVCLFANHAFRRLGEAAPRRLPIETFPERIDGWSVQNETATDPEVLKIIPTARIVTRSYTDQAGHTVQLLLLTAADYKDIHDPRVCFPGHGWGLSNEDTTTIAGQTVTTMTATAQEKKYFVIFYRPGSYQSNLPNGLALAKIMALRKLVTGEAGQALFVRLLVPDDSTNRQIAQDFVAKITPHINNLIAQRTAPSH